MRCFLFVLCAITTFAFATGTADATTLSVRFCNHYRYLADFALAYESSGAWVSTGWWRVAPGKCAAAPAVIPSDSVALTYVYPALQKGLVHTSQKFAVNTDVDRNFRIQNADRPHAGTAMFFFMSSPTYVGSSTFHETFTMLS